MKKVFLAAVSFFIAILLPACSGGAADQVPAETDFTEYEYQYFNPLMQSTITAENWDSADQIPSDYLVEFFGNKTDLSRLSTDADPVVVPGDLVECYIQLYFAIDSAYIRQSVYYDSRQHAYYLPMLGDGGRANVVAVSEKEDMLSLSYEYYSRQDDATVIREGTLNIQFFNPSHYHYISCDTIDKT